MPRSTFGFFGEVLKFICKTNFVTVAKVEFMFEMKHLTRITINYE